MSKKLLSLFSTIIVAAFVITGCGQSDTTNKEQKEDVTKENKTEKTDTTKENKPEEKKSEDKKTENTATSSSDYSKLISYMEKETGGKTKVLFENKEPQVHKAEDISVSMNSYTLVELNGLHTDFNIPFNRQTEGGVILVNYSVKNSSAKDLYYMPALDMSFTGAQKAYSNYRDLIPTEDQLPTKLAPTNDYLVKAGETISGYIAYPFGKDDLAKILSLSTVSVSVPTAQANKGKFDAPIGSPGNFSLSLNKQGAEKVAADKTFYQDKVTANNMGDKKMLKEQSDINNSQELGAVNVTLDGYQFAQFTPNSVEAPRFANFKNGIVLLTVKFKLDNKDTQDVALSPISSTLRVNDGTQYTISEGMLLNYDYNASVKTGTSGELLQVYILDQEQYEKIWKDKSFEIELGPMRNKEAKDISQGKKAKFTLPK
ncbi:DUF5068 domain-containing protein [Bacillus mycoides]|uniref:DUF5068 domain-containing protein n=2 Tax=Bacillus cereus TaxID=1396 RepID=A0A1S9V3I0_BACCE|nr:MULTISPECIES: DUF5068 domain-containing protein [Bacillus cereus group]EJR01150.1 hypothetical protein II3_02048 [Bacillus cereus MC67]EOP12111.1 hypothetical protein II1_03480 [Bacillus cereus MC118]OOR29067.1 DUF5068 domain-containing protein [Bacillus cereus]QWG26319.1 DUF5068 domain-containing protein [Bacillus mycoides]QWG43092.1 DUF5068 domain-containing protein [Bacillus mycoides]